MRGLTDGGGCRAHHDMAGSGLSSTTEQARNHTKSPVFLETYRWKFRPNTKQDWGQRSREQFPIRY